MARDLPAEADGWVACGGAIRPVVGGIVTCPRGPVTVWSCLGCHLLEYSSRERSARGWCDAGPDQRAVPSSAAGSIGG
jgi:hypothetical protein